MEQYIFDNGTVKFPYVIDEGIKYYPITYISEKVLRRKGKITSRHNEHKYKINTYTVNFDFVDGGVQETKCICEKDLRDVLKLTRLGSLDKNQRKYMNVLLDYLNMSAVSEDTRYIDSIDDDIIESYEQYIQDAIAEVDGEYGKWQKCSKCDCYYPYHVNFFKENKNSSAYLYTYCRNCFGWYENRLRDCIKITNKYLNKIYKLYRNEVYLMFKSNDTINIYEFYIKKGFKKIPPMIDNKESYLEIVVYLIKKYKLNKFDISVKVLKDRYRLTNIDKQLTYHDIYEYLHGEDYYLHSWMFKDYAFKYVKLSFDIANKIFKNYMDEVYNKPYDPLTLNYFEIVKQIGIVKILDGDTLYFAVQYNNFGYPGYMFKTQAVNYYKNEKNLLFDLKYLIEKDMRLEVHKIPLYLTKTVLHNKSNSLYRHIVTKGNGSIYEWVNKLYPNKFIEADFEVNPFRNEFDSDTEAFIHEILKEKFSSVIYNQRNTDNTITINGMVPDWLIFTDNGVYIVEYFGMYVPDTYDTSSRIKVYIDKMNNKLNKYKEVSGYKFLFLYPEDVVDDFRGCREKLDEIKENPYVSMV